MDPSVNPTEPPPEDFATACLHAGVARMTAALRRGMVDVLRELSWQIFSMALYLLAIAFLTYGAALVAARWWGDAAGIGALSAGAALALVAFLVSRVRRARITPPPAPIASRLAPNTVDKPAPTVTFDLLAWIQTHPWWATGLGAALGFAFIRPAATQASKTPSGSSAVQLWLMPLLLSVGKSLLHHAKPTPHS